MGVFVTAICSASCSMKCCDAAWRQAWSRALDGLELTHGFMLDKLKRDDHNRLRFYTLWPGCCESPSFPMKQMTFADAE